MGKNSVRERGVAMQAVEVEAESNRPKDTPFRQQRLKACQPILTPLVVVAIFLAVGTVMFTLGMLMWHFNGQVRETPVRYSTECTDPGTTSPPFNPVDCPVLFDVLEDIPGPAYFYYKLTNFYQNHRRYVSSRSDKQLAGNVIRGEGDIDDCTPLIKQNATGNYTTFYNPCGLVASSWFNDEFTAFQDSNSVDVIWDRTQIAWPSDVSTKFKRLPDAEVQADPGIIGVAPPNLDQLPWVDRGSPDINRHYFDVTNPDFIVWMRVAGLPTFRKLYAVIPGGLTAGTYSLTVRNRYSTRRFGGGEKWFVISNTSFIGGKNAFLGYAFIAVGSLCLLMAIGFFLVNLIRPRKLGDPSLLSWNKQKMEQGGGYE